MSNVKINIVECIPRPLPSGKNIFKCKDINGVPYDSWEEVALGEAEYMVKPNANPMYPANIQKPKAFTPGAGNPQFKSNPKKDALLAAASFHHGNIASTAKDVIDTAKAFEEYLKS